MTIRGVCDNCIHEHVCKYTEYMANLIRKMGYEVDPDCYPVGFKVDIIIDCRNYKEVR